VIGGWLPCAGSRREVGALLVGIPEPSGELTFCGAVGAGLAALERRRLAAALEPIGRHTSPFSAINEVWARHARWVRPEILGDVEYREFDRGALRHPSWKGMRADLTVPGAFAAVG
jgi:bifunctional non-homologous end joining protein LigD